MKQITRFFLSVFLTVVTATTSAFASQPLPGEMTLQPAVTPVMHHITEFHTLLLWITTGIVIFVLGLLIYVAIKFNAKANPEPSKTTHNVPLEIVWTLVPVLILLAIAIPSFRLLFFGAVTPEADMTVKVIGNQWNWTYEYPDHGDISYTSIMVKQADLKPGQPPLLTADNALVLPVDTVIRIQVTASDVLHSFAVPAFGVKTDAVPGRLNETWAKIEKPGIYYGQCSELCGKDHGFMPIEVHAVSKEEFATWVASQGGKMPSPEAAEVPAANASAPVPVTSPDAVTRQSDESAKTNAGAEVPANTDINIKTPADAGVAKE